MQLLGIVQNVKIFNRILRKVAWPPVGVGQCSYFWGIHPQMGKIEVFWGNNGELPLLFFKKISA